MIGSEQRRGLYVDRAAESNARTPPPNHPDTAVAVRGAEPDRTHGLPSALLRIDPQRPKSLGEPIGASMGLFGARVLLLGPGIGLLGPEPLLLGPEPLLLGPDAGLNDLWGLGGSADFGASLGLAVQAYSLDQSSRGVEAKRCLGCDSGFWRTSWHGNATAWPCPGRHMATRSRCHATKQSPSRLPESAGASRCLGQTLKRSSSGVVRAAQDVRERASALAVSTEAGAPRSLE